MSQEFSQHAAGDAITTSPNEFFRRTTDRFVRARTGKQPLDVGADRIARTAHAALRTLARVRQNTGHQLPLLWSPPTNGVSGSIEVYPAATLKTHGLPFSGYKNGSEAAAVRDHIVVGLSRLLTLPPDRTALRESDDALDATVCVLAAVDFLENAAMAPENLSVAKKEGWIWVRNPDVGGAT